MEVRLVAAVTAGSLAGVNVAALCADQGISRKTFYKWRARFLAEGLEGLQERSRRPRSSPRRVPVAVEDLIVEWRKALLEAGLDAGPATIRFHLEGLVSPLPSEATIWRVLVRRGFVVPEPAKRPKVSWRRFEADRPNELWQIDATDWTLEDGTVVEIINIVDDHSRVAVACRAVPTTTSRAAWDAFWDATQQLGMPCGCLSDNGLAFSGRLRGVEVFFEAQLRAVGVRPIASRPYHPQTCGKVERFQQTLKRWLALNGPHRDLPGLQHNLETFRAIYNHQRPHSAIGRIPPWQRWNATPAAVPDGQPLDAPPRRTRAVVSNGQAATHRWLFAIGVEYDGQTADILIDTTHAAVYIAGELVGTFKIDHNRRYQPSGRKRGGPRRPRLNNP